MALIHLPVHGIESIIDFFENTVVRFVTDRIACTLNSGMVELLIRFIVESVVLLRHSWGRALFKLSLTSAKTEGGYNTPCISFCSAMIDAYAKWTVLMNRPESNSNFGAVGNLISRIKHLCWIPQLPQNQV